MKGLAVFVFAAFLAMVGLAVGPARASDGVALIIGNNDYAHAPQLRNARKDAERIAKVMKGVGYDVIEAYDADAEKMAEAMDQFADKVKSARIGLVYYAGLASSIGATPISCRSISTSTASATSARPCRQNIW